MLRPVLLALLVWITAGAALAQDKRVALVVGNAAYRHVSELANPVNDAGDMSAALRDQGFEVFSGLNLDLAAMEAVVDEFMAAAADADVTLFYYAGHAFQIASRNYLAPVDLGEGGFGGDVMGVLDQTFPLDDLIGRLDRLDGIRMIFLDACRDNPLGIDGADLVEAGLARVGSGENFWIAFATDPGAVAFDGDGRNGIFTSAMLDHIHTPGQTLDEMMIAVRRDVVAVTGGQQVPWTNSSLTEQFRFDTGRRTVSDETLLYQVAARARSARLMSIYLARYPRGAHAADVQAFLEANPPGEIEDDALPPDHGLSPDGAELWEVAQRTRERSLAERYLDYFPDGAYAEDAARMIDTLPTLQQFGPGQLCERLATHPSDATAAVAGTSMDQLRQTATLAMETCRAAVETFPEQPRFVALLARATWAAGLQAEALALYQEAADRGDLRAIFSLGLLAEAGIGPNPGAASAFAYFERAAEGGSLDGQLNTAYALAQGDVVPQDLNRAIALTRRASEGGSAKATYNLGYFALEGLAGAPEDALDLFRQATLEGETRGYWAAAVMLDEGRGVARDPAVAADLLLRGAAEDAGEIITGIERGIATGDRAQGDVWTAETIREMQARLAQAGLYAGAIDGLPGPLLVEALKTWRRGGFDPQVLGG